MVCGMSYVAGLGRAHLVLLTMFSSILTLLSYKCISTQDYITGYDGQILDHIQTQIIDSKNVLEHIPTQIIASKNVLEHIPRQIIASEEPLEHIPRQIIASKQPLEHIPRQIIDSKNVLEHIPRQIIASKEPLEHMPKQIIDSESLVEHRPKQNPELKKLGNQIISGSGSDAKVKVTLSKNQSALLLNVSHVTYLELSSVVKQNSSRVVSVSHGKVPDVISFPVVYFNRTTMTGHHNELEPESIQCSRPHTFLIYVICTANERENRTLMRQTWLDIHHVTRLKHDGFHVERMFVVGGLAYEAPLVAEAVREESRLYGDILTMDYLQDHYVNVSRKVISAMFWINDHCDLSNVDYVMKADVDTLVNIYFIMSLAWNTLRNNMPFDYICWYLRIKEVDRGGKYSEPWETYGERDWPHYCHGPAYTAHIGIFRMMLDNITKMPILKNEDAMMTGVCVRNKTDLKVYSIPTNRIIMERLDWQYNRGRRRIIRTPHQMIIAHELPPGEWKSAFGRMHNTNLMEHVRPHITVIRS